LGTGTGADQRIAVYEIPSNSNYFYGIGLVEHAGISPGLGLWASTGTSFPYQNATSSTGVPPPLMVSSTGSVGVGVIFPTERLHVVGNILCTGIITGLTKLFDIPHPDPNKINMRLRHWCVESDVPGGMVIYRRQIVATNAQTITLNMSDWFKQLTTNVIIFCNPDEHFGMAWGKYINNNIEIHTNKDGKYNILITCDRNDICATTMCEQEIEYIPTKSVEQTNNLPK